MLICKRCNKSVPDELLACDCFVLRAEEEKLRLALKRFKDDQVLMYLRGGHIYPSRKHVNSICLDSHIKAEDGARTHKITARDLRLNTSIADDVECEKCKKLATSEYRPNP